MAGALALVALVLVELARAVAVGARLAGQDVPDALGLDAGAFAEPANLKPEFSRVQTERNNSYKIRSGFNVTFVFKSRPTCHV